MRYAAATSCQRLLAGNVAAAIRLVMRGYTRLIICYATRCYAILFHDYGCRHAIFRRQGMPLLSCHASVTMFKIPLMLRCCRCHAYDYLRRVIA